MTQLLESCLSREVISKAKDQTFGGLHAATAYLEGEFIRESARLMSGSKSFADSLSDIHEIVRQENQRMKMERDASVDM